MEDNANMATRYEREIPEGYEARIEGNKVIIEQKESDDERIRKAILALVKKHAVNHERCQMKAYLEKQKEQKPAEWSEEDKEMLSSIQQWLDEVEPQYVKKEQDWLKSLPERFNLQPKQEWSEEDEQWLESIIKDYEDNLVKDKDHAAVIKVEIDFLKSLRQKPHWKPSEEQMDHLAYAYTQLKLQKCYAPHVYESLGSLYDDLKKHFSL